MNNTDSGNERLKAAKKFISHLNSSRDRAGFVAWNDDVIDSRSIGLTSEFIKITSILDEDISEEGISPAIGTNYDAALNASIDFFDNDTNSKKCIIFLSDGNPEPRESSPFPAYTPPGIPGSEVDRAKEYGIEIWTVGYSIGEETKNRLEKIADNTGGRYFSANNSTAQEVFNRIYMNMTSLAGKDVTIRYLAPANLIYSIQDFDVEEDYNVFNWVPVLNDSNGPRNYFYIGEKWTKTFEVSSENQGYFYLGADNSKMSYTAQNITESDISIEEAIKERTLLVVPCPKPEDHNCNITNTKYIYSGDSYNITGTNISFGSGSFYINCTPSPGPDGEPPQKVVCVCIKATCPECASATSEDASKVNNINIVQNAIFGSTPYWNGTDEPTGVINLTISRPEASIDAVFAFDVSGSMRLPYEGMDAEDRAAFAEANFSNVSIIGWDEYGAEGAGSGADQLMVPPRPLRESREEVLAALANLSGLCGESDQTVFAAGLQGVLEVDDNFSDHLGGDGKIVLFITGPDEFRPGENLSDLATELKRRSYATYPIGVAIDEIESPLMFDNLSSMANITGGRFYQIDDLYSFKLADVLRDAIAHASSRAAPKDIVVIETLPADLEVRETVPAGADVNVAKNPDGTSTLTWTAKGVSAGEARSLTILAGVNGALASDGIGATGWAGGFNITATGGDAAGINVINMRTKEGDVVMGGIS